jgi:RNA polymerase sigma factor for flagellar operon FliA
MKTVLASTARPSALTAEVLWRRWKDDKDMASRNRLVLSYAPMVKYLAVRKVRDLPAHCELDDLVSSGLVALMCAVDRFDPDKGATFEQYAWTRISGAILDELRRQDWAPRSLRRSARVADDARAGWQSQHGCAPTDGELADVLDMTVVELHGQDRLRSQADVLSLNSPTQSGDDSVGTEIGDLGQAPAQDTNPELAALAHERSAAFGKAVASLSDRERKILLLMTVNELRGYEVGEVLGISQGRVSELLSGIRRKLNTGMRSYDAEAAAA